MLQLKLVGIIKDNDTNDRSAPRKKNGYMKNILNP